MLLQTAAVLVAIGMVSFFIGELFGYHELGALGGVIVVGVGAMMGAGGLEQTVGEIEYEAGNDVITEQETEPVDMPRDLPLDVIVILIGSVFVLRSFESFSQSQ